ncbi:Peptidoglycan O-acetyltransferase [Methyloligella halotolerans]|uniref:Probable alginate O-acetylase AlgI n=1 Tax=Methyloligella halotolerans TaxID=1177755 RepID=A0A1E2RZ22_9HYPH|nr:MBOAT family protein [Methyloligella halotolerans]ODA67483.1 Peptidoglycan O-acetyltransferase [Methyloligella halotolerans]
MLFPTLQFGAFFLVVFAIAWELRARPEGRKTFLVAASYVFYGAWDWRFAGLLAASSLINYAAGRLVSVASGDRDKKILVAIAVAINLGILGFFKYYGFFLEQLGELLARGGMARDMPFLEVILPIGISFFTFQGISYVVDVYRKEIPAETNPLDVFLYISFFPQLVAGPIVRAADFLPQLKAEPELDREMVAKGIVLILLGLFKKMVIANYLATLLVDDVFFAPDAYSGPDLLLAVYGYAIQIYCDFSGYSDIAIGVAALLGYHFKPNFLQPYRSASLREFWRRWHISLSTWLRDYLYKPLGGSRHGTVTTYRNVMITMVLGGLWHGANWTFLIWGAIHGVALVIERMILAVLPASGSGVVAGDSFGGAVSAGWGSAPSREALVRAFGVLVTFNVVCLAWIFFRAESLDYALLYLQGLVDWSGPVEMATPFLVALVAVSLAAHFLPEDLLPGAIAWLEDRSALTLGAVLGFGILLIWAIAPEGVAPFIYFQF